MLLMYERTSPLNPLGKQPLHSDTSVSSTPGLLLYLCLEEKKDRPPLFLQLLSPDRYL